MAKKATSNVNLWDTPLDFSKFSTELSKVDTKNTFKPKKVSTGQIAVDLNPKPKAKPKAKPKPKKVEEVVADNSLDQFPFGTPEQIPLFDKNGNLLPQFKLDVTQARPETDWLRQQRELENQRYNLYVDDARAASNAAQQTGLNTLAMTGGLSSGARERLADTSQLGLSNQLVGLNRDRTQNLYGYGMQDYANQIAADKFNIANAFGGVGMKGGFDWSVFDTKAKAYGADQVANAYEKQASDAAKAPGWDTMREQADQIFNPVSWSWNNQSLGSMSGLYNNYSPTKINQQADAWTNQWY